MQIFGHFKRFDTDRSIQYLHTEGKSQFTLHLANFLARASGGTIRQRDDTTND